MFGDERMDELRDFLRSRGKITLTLVVVNILLFFCDGFQRQYGKWSLHAGARSGLWAADPGKWEYYRLFTSMFLHFGIEHLFGNMLTLIFLGDLLEKMIGKFRFILIYFLGGLAGNLLSLAKEMITGNYAISAGASGAIFAVVGALVFLVVRHRGKLPGTSGQRLAVMALLTLADGFVSTGVDYMAHLGGMAAGFVLAGDTGRKTETEGRSLFPGRISDVTAVSSGDPLNQRETKAGTVLLVGDKGRKDLILNLRGNTDAVIRHLDHKPVFIAKAGKANLRCPGFKSVPEKIRDGLAKLYRIAVYCGEFFGKTG